jgi:hypothetical protein
MRMTCFRAWIWRNIGVHITKNLWTRTNSKNTFDLMKFTILRLTDKLQDTFSQPETNICFLKQLKTEKKLEENIVSVKRNIGTNPL